MTLLPVAPLILAIIHERATRPVFERRLLDDKTLEEINDRVFRAFIPFGALLAELDLRFGFSLISLSFSQSLSSQILVNGINLVSPLMSWSRRYRVNSYIRSSVWIIPLVAAVVEQAAAALAHMLDARLAGQATFFILVLLVLLVIIHFSDLLGVVGSGALVPRQSLWPHLVPPDIPSEDPATRCAECSSSAQARNVGAAFVPASQGFFFRPENHDHACRQCHIR
jgi:hypothetical protein